MPEDNQGQSSDWMNAFTDAANQQSSAQTAAASAPQQPAAPPTPQFPPSAPPQQPAQMGPSPGQSAPHTQAPAQPTQPASDPFGQQPQQPYTQTSSPRPIQPHPDPAVQAQQMPYHPGQLPQQQQPMWQQFQEPQQPPQPPPQQPPAQNTLAAQAQQAGIDPTGLSSEQIAAQLAEKVQQLQPYAAFGQQIMPYADDIKEYFEHSKPPEGQQQQTQDPQQNGGFDPDQYFAQKWAAPKWDDQYTWAIQNGVVARDEETGMYVPQKGMETIAMPLLNGMNQAQQWQHQQWQSIIRDNPYKLFYENLLEPMRHAWQQDLEQAVNDRLAQHQAQQNYSQYERDNAAWMYQRDPATGQQVPTQMGQQFFNEINRWQQRGIEDPGLLIELAEERVRLAQQQQPQQHAAMLPQPGAPTYPAQVNQPPMPQVTQPPTAGFQQPPQAAMSPAQASAQQTQSFVQNAMNRAQHAPNAGGYMQQSPMDPQVVSENELDSLFSNAYRQWQGHGRVAA